MAGAKEAGELYRSSILVTGTHYSMTTLAGRLLASAPEYHLLHEPLNAEPTPSYDSVAPSGWYQYDCGDDYRSLRAKLADAIAASNFLRTLAGQTRKARSGREALQVARYAQRKLPMRLSRKPAIIKDPFLAFTAREMQREDGLRIVLTVRHPCAFVESFMRAGHDFDFADLLQPALLQLLPEGSDAIERLAAGGADRVEQAASLWRIVYGYAAEQYARDRRTFVMRQDDLVGSPVECAERLFAFAGVRFGPASQRFLGTSLAGSGRDFAGDTAYTTRSAEGILDKWKTRLDHGDIVRVAKLTGTVAAEYGYDTDRFADNARPER